MSRPAAGVRPTSTTIDLIRHADVHNPADVFYGRLPRFRLSELGRAQAVALANRLAEAPLGAIYTSPMLRARQTAAILADRHPSRPPVRRAVALTEVRSHWQGRASAELDAIQFNFYDQARDGDEDIPTVFARVGGFVRRLARRHAGGYVVCVSHADPIAIARAGLAGRPLVVASIRHQPDYPAKTSITRLVFTGDASEWPTITYLAP